MTQVQRIGILGGMFDPIHCGHLDVGDAAEQALALTEVLVIPANRPPHRAEPVASSYHRFAMAAMAVAARQRWRAIDLELRDAGVSYTSATLRRFHAGGVPATALFFILGADAFLEIATWHEYPGVLDLAHFAVVARPGIDLEELPKRLPALGGRMRASTQTAESTHGTCIFLIEARTADVSSTAIRQARLDGKSIAGLVPPAVHQHIEQHGLYGRSLASFVDSFEDSGPTAGRLHGQH